MVLDWGELHPWMQGLHQLRGLLRRLLVLKLRAVVRGGWRSELGRLAYAQTFWTWWAWSGSRRRGYRIRQEY